MQMTSGLTSSATPEWATPQWLFDLLNEEFRFTLDVCATEDNAKCADFYTEQDDGLSQEWYGTVWCNPPYGRAIGAWVRKCAESNPGGGKCSPSPGQDGNEMVPAMGVPVCDRGTVHQREVEVQRWRGRSAVPLNAGDIRQEGEAVGYGNDRKGR